MNVFEAMMVLGRYFNEGEGKDADQETKDAWNGIRDFVTAMMGAVMDDHA